MPSDHAPVPITVSLCKASNEGLVTRPGWLRDHIPGNSTVKSISIEGIDVEELQQQMVETQIPDTNTSVDKCAAGMSESLSACMKAAKNDKQQRENMMMVKAVQMSATEEGRDYL